jgi:hypothetical protein
VTWCPLFAEGDAADRATPDRRAVADRIATFDNDGTLWVEQPLPPQFDFVFRRWGEEIRQDPSLAGQQPYKAIVEKDMSFFERLAVQDPETVETLLKAFARSWAGAISCGSSRTTPGASTRRT